MSSADSRVCLITGAAGGIGLAIAQRFAGAGEHVVIGDVDTGRGRSAARATGATFVALDV
ncbi:MAG: SDR family NAD(P)-dependent oxidoreductase, partial [Pseudomonadota bacterium]